MARHWHPVLRMYISPLTTSRTFTVRLLPPCFAGPMSGSTWLHSSAPVLVIDPLQPSGGGRNGLAHLANQLNGALVASSMRATYSPSIFGTHHIFSRHGLSLFSAKRRRTVSPERLP